MTAEHPEQRWNLAQYRNIAKQYEGSPAQVANDQQLNSEMNSGFDMSDPNINAKTVTTAAPEGWGMTSDQMYVDPRHMSLTYATTDHKPNGYNSYHISPAALKFAGTSNHYIFMSIAGHELIHGYHWMVFGMSQPDPYNYWSTVGGKYSEVAAWTYSQKVFMNAGDFVHAQWAAGRILDYSGGGVNAQYLINVPIFR